MARVYSAPKELKSPKLNVKNIKKYQEDTEKYLQSIKDWCKKHGSGKYKGEEVNFPVADGHATYVVFSDTPLELIHCDIYDGYDYPYIERLKKKDIIDRIKMDKELASIFGCK